MPKQPNLTPELLTAALSGLEAQIMNVRKQVRDEWHKRVDLAELGIKAGLLFLQFPIEPLFLSGHHPVGPGPAKPL